MKRLQSFLPLPNRALRVVAASALAASALAIPSPVPAQRPNMGPDINIDQATLMDGGYTFRKVVESGRHLFSVPFTADDGLDEGPNGPRAHQRLFDGPGFGYIRMNGLDAQSCFECHNSIGETVLFDTESQARTRKIGVNGGPAGRSANAFINPNFPDPIVGLIRNPPHVFGTGYVQQLMEEMSLDLLSQRASARLEAMDRPGDMIERELASKGTRFGVYRVRFTGARGSADAKSAMARGGDGFEEDMSGVEGVSEDFSVRGLQWKGIASNERNFEKDALNFHFGIEAMEFFFAEDPDNPGQVIVEVTDNDGDGVENEITPGNVSAISVFTLSIRPPNEVIPAGMEEIVARGRAIFTGAATDVVPQGALICASCHTPSLKINSSEATILDPTHPSNFARTANGQTVGLSVPRASSRDLPIIQRFERMVEGLDQNALRSPDSALQSLQAAAKRGDGVGVGYHFDLTDMQSLPLSYPRLPENADGSIDVPLFSDLRRHDMGEGLKDNVPQGTDAAGVMVQPRLFLTRPLWGVADSGPWLHDGRATTLRQAILLHESEGSEANPAIQLFRSLSAEDQNAVIEFLLTFRLPMERTFELGEPMGVTNISTRGQVGTGDFVMIAGFTITDTPKTVLITGKGPSLTPFGVPNALANPQIRLFRGQTQIDFNDDWQNASNASAIAGLANGPTNTLEAALFLTLEPGAYTIHLEGSGGATGQGLVEVWEQSPQAKLLATTGSAGFAIR
jgi:hypothetical protein